MGTPSSEHTTLPIMMGMKRLDDDDLAIYWASPRRRQINRAVLGFGSRLGLALRRHWVFLANLIVGFIAGLAVLTPLLAASGLTSLTTPIFQCYGLICSQTPGHSYVLFGHQMPLCQRDLAIYSAMLVGGIAYGLSRPARALDWRLYALLVLPMAVDGLTQLVGWRQSNWELRTVTGALFGLATVWFAYPELGNATDAPLREARA